MVSRTLVKLIDQAITPAILLVCSRIISVVLVSYFLGINLTIDGKGFSFPTAEDYIKVNSYSTFLMVLILTGGLLYILVKALIFHDTHISPQLTAKIFTVRLSSFIQSSYDIYSQGMVWLSYSYLLLVVVGIFTFSGLIYKWVFFANLIMTIITTVVMVFDIENEIYMKKNQDTYFEDDTYIDVEGGLDEEA